MDDGNLNLHKNRFLKNGERTIRNRSITIATNCFSYEDHLEIKKWFGIRHGIDAKIYKQRNGYRTVFNATGSNKLIEIIRPYIIPSMYYKIDMQYST